MLLTLLLLQNPTVTIEPKVARIEVHLQDFSKSAPKPHRADSSVTGDTLAIRFEKTDLAKARELVAEALRANWREEKDAWVLYRTPETLKAFADEEFALRESSIRAGQAAARKESDVPFDGAVVAAQINAKVKAKERFGNVDGTPIKRLATKLASMFEPSVASRLPFFERITYVDQSPTPLQRPMSKPMRAAVKEFWTDLESLRTRIEPTVALYKVDTYERDGSLSSEKVQPGKVLFEIRRGDFGLEFRVYAHGGDGSLVANAQYALGGTPAPKVPEVLSIPSATITPPPQGAYVWKPADEAWQNRCRDPVAADPLDWVWGDFIRGVAATSDASICLWLTDRESTGNANEFRVAMRTLVIGGYKLRFTNNELVGTPNRIASKRARSVSRFALRDLASRATLFRSPTMEDWARFFAATPAGYEAVVPVWFRMKTGYSINPTSRAAVMFWSSLPEGVRPEPGKKLEFTSATLSPESKKALMLVDSAYPLALEDQPSEASRFWTGTFTNWKSPSDLLILHSALGWEDFSPILMGIGLASRDHPEKFPRGVLSPSPDAYRGGRSQWVLIALREPDADGTRAMVYDSEVRLWSADTRVTLEELPEEIRTQVLQSKAEALANSRNSVSGGDGRVPPPH